ERRERWRHPVHPMDGAVRRVAARISLRRPLPARRIIQAELPALAQEPLLEPAAGRAPKARRVYECREKLLHGHRRSIGNLRLPVARPPTRYAGRSSARVTWIAADRRVSNTGHERPGACPIAPHGDAPSNVAGEPGVPEHHDSQ